MTNAIAPYRKAASAFVGAALLILVAAQSDGIVTAAEFVQVFAAGLMAIGVYQFPNTPIAKFVKSVIAAATVAVGLLGGYLAAGDEITNAMWLNVAVHVLAALGVIILPNEPEAAVPPTADTSAKAA